MDQTLQILIETLAKGNGGEMTIREQKALKQILDQVRDSTEMTVREMRVLEKAARAAGSESYEAFRKANGGGSGGGGGSPPAPPAPSSQGGGGTGSAMRRHFGAIGGQILGMPGMGMMMGVGGAAAAIGGIVLVLEKVISKFNEWNESISQTVRHSMEFDLMGTRVATLGTLTRQVSEHNKDLALSYSQVERNIRTVSAEIAHLSEIQTLQLKKQQDLDDALLEKQKARIDLATRFNPIARIEQTEAAERAHFDRQMERLRAELELRRKLHLMEGERAGEAEKNYTAEADALKATLPGLQKKALVDEGQAGTIAEQNARRRAEMIKELELVNEMALGKSIGFGYTKYRVGAPSHLNPSTAASDALFGDVFSQAKAAARKAELEKGLEDLNNEDAAAKQAALITKGRADRVARAAAFAEEKAKGLNEEGKKAVFEAEQDKARIEATEATLQQEIDARNKARQDKSRTQILDSVQPQNISVPGGGVSTGNSALLEKLDRLAMQNDIMINIWTTGGSGAA